MIRLVLFLLAAVAASLAAAWLADNPGRVALTWQGMHIETSFAVMAIALVLLVLLAIALFELLRLLGAAPRRISRHMRRSRTDKGYEALAQGLVAAAAGDTAAAKALNRRADKHGQTPMPLDNESLKTLYSDGLYDDNKKTWQEAFPMKEQFEVQKKKVEQ